MENYMKFKILLVYLASFAASINAMQIPVDQAQKTIDRACTELEVSPLLNQSLKNALSYFSLSNITFDPEGLYRVWHLLDTLPDELKDKIAGCLDTICPDLLIPFIRQPTQLFNSALPLHASPDGRILYWFAPSKALLNVYDCVARTLRTIEVGKNEYKINDVELHNNFTRAYILCSSLKNSDESLLFDCDIGALEPQLIPVFKCSNIPAHKRHILALSDSYLVFLTQNEDESENIIVVDTSSNPIKTFTVMENILQDHIRAMFSNDKKFLLLDAFTDNASDITLHELQSNTLLFAFPEDHKVGGFSPNSQKIATYKNNNEIHIWSCCALEQDEPLRLIFKDSHHYIKEIKFITDTILEVYFSDDVTGDFSITKTALLDISCNQIFVINNYDQNRTSDDGAFKLSQLLQFTNTGEQFVDEPLFTLSSHGNLANDCKCLLRGLDISPTGNYITAKCFRKKYTYIFDTHRMLTIGSSLHAVLGLLLIQKYKNENKKIPMDLIETVRKNGNQRVKIILNTLLQETVPALS